VFTSLFSRMRPWLSEPGNLFAASLYDIAGEARIGA
jgi:hypothetical protein